MFIYMKKKSTLFLTSFLRYHKRTTMGTLGMLDHPYQDHTINLDQPFMLICMQKINFIIHLFLKVGTLTFQKKCFIWFNESPLKVM